jgi:uncharacterized protein
MNAAPDISATSASAVCQRHIDRLVEAHAQIDGALVSTVDGFEMASRVNGEVSAARLAAMTSSFLALAEAISEESAVGTCRDLVIDAKSGRVLLMEISRGTQKFVLTVLCDNSETLGQVLWAARSCRELIARELGEY